MLQLRRPATSEETIALLQPPAMPPSSILVQAQRAMDLKTLKLELLERIALLDDEARLLALKRLLDAARGYGIPNEHLGIVLEGEERYIKLEDRSYSVDEVRRLMEKAVEAKGSPPGKRLRASRFSRTAAAFTLTPCLYRQTTSSELMRSTTALGVSSRSLIPLFVTR